MVKLLPADPPWRNKGQFGTYFWHYYSISPRKSNECSKFSSFSYIMNHL